MTTTRLEQLARDWRTTIERTTETLTSVVAYGSRGSEAVVLKVTKSAGDEWHAGALAAAFEGRGMVRVLECIPGAVLMEQLQPATPLAELVEIGRDDQATEALAGVIAQMSSVSPQTSGYQTVTDWGRAFDRYLASTDTQIASDLVAHARERYRALCETQSVPRLLHGDLQHYNVVSDRTRGWVAIDPKGVVGELEFELGAACRNPRGHPELYSSPSAVLRRIDSFAHWLDIDIERAAAWAYSQAVLSAVWSIEDHGVITADEPALQLAAALRPVVIVI